MGIHCFRMGEYRGLMNGPFILFKVITPSAKSVLLGLRYGFAWFVRYSGAP